MADRPTYRRLITAQPTIPLLALIALVCWPTPPLGGTFCAASELRQTPVVRAVQKARESVVNIKGEKTVPAAGAQVSGTSPGRRVNGMGTGVVLDPRGYILTNFHVVEGVRQINVTFADRTTCVAELIARDTDTDLAVIKVAVDDPLPVIDLGISTDLMPGEPVIAVGNAYGYEHTVTRGIISALQREVQVSDAQFYNNLIQTDASINPGNSGGPLLNIDGEMIGVNVAVRAGAQGIGFAIPVDIAMSVASRLIATSAAATAWHGIETDDASNTPGDGVRVASVEENSPAAKAGVQSGDLITAVNGVNVQRPLDFHREMLERVPGEKLEFRLRRAGEPVSAELAMADVPLPLKPMTSPAWDVLGLELQPIPADDFKQRSTRYRGGLLVKTVRENSPSAEHGIRPGDVLVGMHIWETVTMDNIAYVLRRPDFASLNPLKVFVLRDSETLYAYLPLNAQKTARR